MINLNQKTYSQPIAFILTLLLVFSMFVPMAYVYGADETDTPVVENPQEQPQIEGNAPVESTGPALPGEGTDGSNAPGALPGDEEEVVEAGLPAGEVPVDGEGAVMPETPTEPALLAAPLMVGPQAEAADRSVWLGNLLTLTIKQDGKTIPSGGQIDPTKDFEVEGNFPLIPLKDDGSGIFLNPGDSAILELDGKLSLASGTPPVTHNLTYGGKNIGTLTFESMGGGSGLQAKIVFDNASLWDDYTDIENLSFSAILKYDGSGIVEGEDAKDVTILGKTYKIYKPIVPIEPFIQKKGEFNQTTGEIIWTVTADAIKAGTPGQSLKDMVFTDNLSKAGSYVSRSIDIEDVALSDAEKEALYNDDAKTLTYTFGDVNGPKTITYKTELTADQISKIGLQEMKFTNSAKLNDKTATTTVTIKTVPQIKKVGRVDEHIDGTSVSSIDYKNRSITWYIEVNQQKAERENLTITDKLPAELTFVKAQWQTYDGSAWVNTGTAIAPPEPTNGIYLYDGGKKTSDHLRLVIETLYKVEDNDYVKDNKTINNTATVTWNGMPGGTELKGSDGVGVGFDALTKSGLFDNNWASNHLVNWTIKLNFKGQFSTGNLANFKIYDLLVHDGKSFSFDGCSFTDKDNVSVAEPAIWDKDKLTPQYGQKYNALTSATSGLTVTQIKVMKDGKHVADLIEISGFTTDQAYEVKFSSKMINPEEFIKNGRATAHNTATLFEGTTKKKNMTASPYKDVTVLTKNVLDGATEESALNGNTLAGDPGNGFNHNTKTAFFRLNINANGQTLSDPDFNLSPFIVTDKLPAGWKFDQTWNTKGYKIFGSNGTTELTGAGDPVSGSVVFGKDGDRETVVFTFNPLNDHYFILVKAVLPDEVYAEYIKNNAASITVQNDATLSGGGVTVGSNADVKVETGVVSKDLNRIKDGVLQWTIEYNPLTAAIVAKHDDVFIKDTLGQGFELRLTSQGGLDLSGDNIYIEEMDLKVNGDLAVKSPRTNLAAELLTSGDLTYDTAARMLKIHVPDGQKAYRVTYLTELTGAKDVTVENNVIVEGVTARKTDSKDSYQISDSDATAMLVLGGYLRVKKVDSGDDAPLLLVQSLSF